MSRPVKCRRVCRMPAVRRFQPAGSTGEPVLLTVDEYEAVRLIDLEGLSQEQCSARMEIARTTVQKIWDTARRKLAAALVEGRPLEIGGGEYRLCSGRESCGQFLVCDAEQGVITASKVVDTDGSGHGALAGLLQDLGADCLICGGIGGGARAALDAAGITVYGGVTGSALQAAAALAAGGLNFDPSAHCDHHDREHGAGHTCGEQGCGKIPAVRDLVTVIPPCGLVY